MAICSLRLATWLVAPPLGLYTRLFKVKRLAADEEFHSLPIK
jgi:hypothetical protein